MRDPDVHPCIEVVQNRGATAALCARARNAGKRANLSLGRDCIGSLSHEAGGVRRISVTREARLSAVVGYTFTNLYGLRWDAPRGTAYPATFFIDRQGTVFFERIAKLRAGRTTAAEVIELLPTRKPKR
jgi:hypothetical protein